MATIVRSGAFVIGLCVVAAGIAAERNAEKSTALKNAVDTLITRLDNVSHDTDMTTAKKAIVAADAIEKFNQKYKGTPLTVRLKVQDVAPSAQGQCLTANNPNLYGVQFYPSKFQTNLSSAEVMSVTKDNSVLLVTGMVSAAQQPQPRIRSDRSETLKPGSSIAFPLRANPACRICLDNISYQLEGAPASDSAQLTPGKTTAGNTSTDKTKSEQSRSVDDIKLFFLKGLLQTQHTSGSSNTGATAKPGTGQSSGSYPRPGYSSSSSTSPGSAKVKHNRIYTVAALMQKFGSPSARTSSATAEQWDYKCKDGVVHVKFTQVGVGYARSSSTSKAETLRLEVKSVDSSSSTGSSRF